MNIAGIITEAEANILVTALRMAQYAAADLANNFDRQFGPEDGRAKEAWRDAHKRQEEIRVLARKLNLPV